MLEGRCGDFFGDVYSLGDGLGLGGEGMLGEEGPDEGAAEVVEALDVRASGVADGPQVQNALEEELNGGVVEEGDGRCSPW